MTRVLLPCLAATFLAGASPAAAHPVPFSYLDVRLEAGAIDVTLVAHVVDIAHDLGIDRPESLLNARVLDARGDAVTALFAARFRLTADGRTLAQPRWDAPEALPGRQSVRLHARYAATRTPGLLAAVTKSRSSRGRAWPLPSSCRLGPGRLGPGPGTWKSRDCHGWGIWTRPNPGKAA